MASGYGSEPEELAPTTRDKDDEGDDGAGAAPAPPPAAAPVPAPYRAPRPAPSARPGPAAPAPNGAKPSAAVKKPTNGAKPAAPSAGTKGGESRQTKSTARAAASNAGDAKAAAGGAPAKAAPRRGPGRPSKRTPGPQLEFKGIVDGPENKDNRFELSVGSPEIFKLLFTYFKGLYAQGLFIRCSKTAMTFFARDHSTKSRVLGRVEGQHVNWFYNQAEFWFDLTLKDVEKMFTKIDRNYYKITFSVTHDDPETIHCCLKDAETSLESHYFFKKARLEPDPDLTSAEDEIAPERLSGPGCRFPIQFTLSSKKFKKIVTDCMDYTDQITIEQIGADGPLSLRYTTQKTTYDGVFRNPEKINLYTEVGPGQTFRCPIALDNIKPLATSMVTDTIRILAREDGDILIKSAVDDRMLVVYTLTRVGA